MKRTLMVLVLLAGCKDKEPAAPPPPPPAAPVAPAAPAAPTAAAAPNMAQAQAAQMAAMQNMMKQTAGMQQKTAVNWRELMPLLGDDLDGWKAAGDAKGETNTAGAMSVSQVERHYKKDGKDTTVQIFDTAVMPMLANAFQMARMMSKDGSDGYARGVTIGGNPGWDEWHKGESAEVTLLVNSRFLLKAHASGLPDSKGLSDMLNKVDLGKLAALNK